MRHHQLVEVSPQGLLQLHQLDPLLMHHLTSVDLVYYPLDLHAITTVDTSESAIRYI